MELDFILLLIVNLLLIGTICIFLLIMLLHLLVYCEVIYAYLSVLFYCKTRRVWDPQLSRVTAVIQQTWYKPIISQAGNSDSYFEGPDMSKM